jgi:hypothetical protein
MPNALLEQAVDAGCVPRTAQRCTTALRHLRRAPAPRRDQPLQ